MSLTDYPLRAAIGAYVLNSGLSKRSLEGEAAEGVHGMASGAIPPIEKIQPATFAQLLSGTEIALGCFTEHALFLAQDVVGDGPADGHLLFVLDAFAPADGLRLERSLDSARRWGLVSRHVLGSDFSVEMEIRRGAGGFVLGEETALMESLEGRRAMPRAKPPFPVESGLWGRPTVINNVETLSAVPLIVGGQPAAATTKLYGLSGHVACPGVVEVAPPVTLRRLVEELGGGLRDGRERACRRRRGGPPAARGGLGRRPGRRRGAVLGSGPGGRAGGVRARGAPGW